MGVPSLLGSLCVRIRTTGGGVANSNGGSQPVDVAVIFAEPSAQELNYLFGNQNLTQYVLKLLQADTTSEQNCFSDSLDYIACHLAGGGGGGGNLNVATVKPEIKVEESLESAIVSAVAKELFDKDAIINSDGVDGVEDFLLEDDANGEDDNEVEEEEEEMLSKRRRRTHAVKRTRARIKRNDPDGDQLDDQQDKKFWPFVKISDTKYMCEVCNKFLTNSSNMKKHIQTHGINAEPIEDRTCPHCGKIFDYALLCRKHYLQNVCKLAKVPQCDQCSETFLTGEELREHRRLVHDVEKLRCAYCQLVCSTAVHRRLHEKRVHLNLFCSDCKKYFDEEAERDSHKCDPSRYQCDQCDKNYKNKGDMRLHVLKVHRGVKPSFEGDRPCDICGAILSSARSLLRHKNTVHETEKNVRCEICGKGFKTKADLRGHLKTHDDTKSDPCPECGKRLSSNDHLQTHIKVVHRKMEFRHVCYDCGKCFPYAKLLNMHKETRHSSGEFLVCTVCSKNIRGHLKMAAHMSKCHPEGQERIPCEYCGKEVPRQQMKTHVVEAHKMQEYRFQCDQCPKRFNKRADIRNHYRKHTGARPFACQACGQYFVSLKRVREHLGKCHDGDISHAFYDKSRDLNNPWIDP